MRIRYGGSSSLSETARSFLSSPVIVAIVAGTVLNLAGAGPWLTSALVPAAAIAALEMLGNIIGPLILIVIGYGTRISPRGIREVGPLVLLRLAVVLAVGLLVVPPVIEGLLGLPRIFTHAVFTFLVLPPPFIIPLYIRRRKGKTWRTPTTLCPCTPSSRSPRSWSTSQPTRCRQVLTSTHPGID
jgi:predicted permease